MVAANPFPELAQREPKRFQATFLSEAPNPERVKELEQFAAECGEPFAARGRVLYAFHSNGIHLSKLGNRITPKRLDVAVATARNWTTVTTLLAMASGIASDGA